MVLRRAGDHCNQLALVSWTPEIRLDLEWWLTRSRLEEGTFLAQVSPQLDLWSDASDVGWGAHLGEEVASGLWALEKEELSINARELLAMEYGLRFFAPQISNSTVVLFADNSTVIPYLRNQGGTRSPLLNSIAQRILRWAESLPVVLAPQFIMGRNNVLADSLSRPNQISGSEWTLKTEVFQDLRKRWPVSIDLFATSLNHQYCPYFFSVPRSERAGHGCSAPELARVAGVCLSSLVSHSCGVEEAPVVLWSPDHHCSVLASETLVSGASGSGGGRSDPSPIVSRPPGGVRAVSSCVETIQRCARSQGFSSHVARQSSLARRSSSCAGHQAKWAYTGSGAVRKDIPSLFLRWPTFCFGFVGRGNCLYLLLWDTAQCFRRFLVFSFLRYLLRL